MMTMLKSLIRASQVPGHVSSLGLKSEQLQRTFSRTVNYEEEQLRTFSEDHSRIKITLPHWAIPAFIGRKGNNIKAIREKYSPIKITVSTDYFPGLKEQVVMIEGTTDNVIQIVHEVNEFHQKLPLPDTDDGRAKKRQKGVNLVIPSSSFHMFIGSDGETATQIREDFKLKALDINLMQNLDDFNEKLMYIYGEDANMKEGVEYMIKKLNDGPLLRSFGEDHSQIKITLPNWAVPAFIGKKGDNIEAIRGKYSPTKIIVSSNYFPGLEEQVVMIEGTTDNVVQIVHEVNEFHQKLPLPDNDDGRAEKRQKGVNFVIPSSSAGMFIGSGGETATQIQEQFKLDRLSVKGYQGTNNFHEKSIFIYGEDANMKEAVDYMIKRLKDGPMLDKNLSYM